MKKTAEKKVLRSTLKPGDVFWFSGFWCTFVRFGANGRGYGRFPYTPPDKEVWMFHGEDPDSDWAKKYGPHMVTVKEGAKVEYDPSRSPWG